MKNVAQERTNDSVIDLEHTELSGFLCGDDVESEDQPSFSSATQGEDHEIRIEPTSSSQAARDGVEHMQFSDTDISRQPTDQHDEGDIQFDDTSSACSHEASLTLSEQIDVEIAQYQHHNPISNAKILPEIDSDF